MTMPTMAAVTAPRPGSDPLVLTEICLRCRCSIRSTRSEARPWTSGRQSSSLPYAPSCHSRQAKPDPGHHDMTFGVATMLVDLAEGVVDVGPAAFVAATRRSGCGRRSLRPSASSVDYFSEAGGSRRAMRWRARLEAGRRCRLYPDARRRFCSCELCGQQPVRSHRPDAADLVAFHGPPTPSPRQIDEIVVTHRDLVRSCPRHGLHRRALRDLVECGAGRRWCDAGRVDLCGGPCGCLVAGWRHGVRRCRGSGPTGGRARLRVARPESAPHAVT